jgi:hypothetical protein
MIESRGRTRFDNNGHLEPNREARLSARAAESQRSPERVFFAGSEAEDDLAEELGEGAVLAMTTGEDTVASDFNYDVEEDWGGPFVETTANKEFAFGLDESNIAGATREPFPTV